MNLLPPPRSISRRLLWALTAVLAASSVLIVAIVAAGAYRYEEAELRQGLNETADQLARMLAGPLWETDIARAGELASASTDPRVARIVVRERVFNEQRTVARSSTTDTVSTSRVVRRDGQDVGLVELSFDRAPYRQQVRRDIEIAAAVSLIALVASLIGVRLLLRRLLERPIRDLSGVVSAYAAGEYHQPRAPIGYGELRTFGEVLDEMARRIVGQLHALQESNVRLEGEVTVRQQAEKSLRARNRELQALNAILAAGAREVDPGELVARGRAEIGKLLDLGDGGEALTDELGRHTIVTIGPGAEFLRALTTSAAPEVRALLGDEEPVISGDADSDARVARLRPLLAAQGIGALVLLPLVSAGACFGYIELHAAGARVFTPDQCELAERIAAQVALALARHRARAAERLLRATIEQVPEFVIITDAMHRVVYVNPALSAVTGMARESALGSTPELLLGPQEDPQQFEILRRALHAGDAWAGRLTVSRPSGKPAICDAVVAPVRDHRGVRTHNVGILHDVTREIERDEQLRHAQKMEAVGQLAGGIAHDFNNILGAIMLQLEQFDGSSGDATLTMQTVHDVRASAERAARLTRQLLMFSRRQAMDVRTHDLNVVVAELLRMLARLIGERITISFRQGASPLLFAGDSGMIEQVVMNLCVNARDAMEAGGQLSLATQLVHVTPDEVLANPSRRPGRFARLDVTDTGCGMSPETLARIYEPFFTTKAIGHGTGLGLATTHGLVTQHQGWLEVESALGAGTTFRVFLPAVDAATPQAKGEEKPALAVGSARLLVVEDEEIIRRLVARSLRKLGYEVREAGNANEAEREWRAANGAIDLLLTDMVMPEGVSGLELTAKLRRESPALKVVVMSGYSLDLTDAGSGRPKDVHFILKPFNLAALSDVVRQALAPNA